MIISRTSQILINKSSAIPGTRGCNSILFLNSGNVNAYINNVIKLIPGSSLEVSQPNYNIIDYTDYNARFDVVNPVTDQPNLIVISTFHSEQ